MNAIDEQVRVSTIPKESQFNWGSFVRLETLILYFLQPNLPFLSTKKALRFL